MDAFLFTISRGRQRRAGGVGHRPWSLVLLVLLGWLTVGRAWGQNLIINPGFEAQPAANYTATNVGFTFPGYSFTPPGTNDPGAGFLAIRTGTLAYNPGFGLNNVDHTSGSGNMLLVNASVSATSAYFWQQTVTVAANTSYVFSYWLINNFFAAPGVIQTEYSLDGGTTFTTATPTFQNTSGTTSGSRSNWQLSPPLTIATGSATQLIIRLTDLTRSSNGDDFSIDDLNLSPTSAAADVATTLSTSAPASVGPGTSLSYSVRLLNNGPQAATNVVAQVQLPIGLTSAAFTGLPAGASYDNTTGRLTLPAVASLPSGAAGAQTITFGLTAPPYSATIAATASSTATTADLTPGNNDGSLAAARTSNLVVLPANGCGGTPYGPSTSSGLYAEYYNGYFGSTAQSTSGADNLGFFASNTPVLARYDAQVNFPANNSWGNLGLSGATNGNANSYQQYSARYRGSFSVPTAGNYVLTLTSDDASYLWIDGAALAATPTLASAAVDNGGAHGSRSRSSVTLTLSAGLHDVLIFYGQAGGDNTLTFSYTSSAGGSGTVPNALLCATKAPAVPQVALTGFVYEDANYGGGSGRSRATLGAAAAVRPGVIVELYDTNGNYAGSTVTDASGRYSFTAASGATYTVRVVNRSVVSSRAGATFTGSATAGYVSDQLAVQTYNGTTSRVGGEAPSRADAGPNTSSASLSSLNTTTTAAQSVATVALGSGPTTGPDFGFNFDVIVNVNDAGQGSLRQFILNANALGGESSLAQAGSFLNQIVGAPVVFAPLPAGIESSIFMIADGGAHDGILASVPGQLTGGVAVVSPRTALPALTGPSTSLNGWTQTRNIGNSNDVIVGTGGTVGSTNTVVPQYNGPEVQISGTAAVAVGLELGAGSAGSNVLGLAVLGFGGAPNSDGAANLRLNPGTGNTVRVQGTFVGASAKGASAAGGSGADGIRVLSGTALVLAQNLIEFHAGQGIALSASVTATISGSEVRGNGIGTSLPSLLVLNGGSSVLNNLVTANGGAGLDLGPASTGVSVSGNTFSSNGAGLGAGPTFTPGVRVGGSGHTLLQNSIINNYGAGVLVLPTALNNVISQNAIAGNGNGPGSGGAAPTGEIGIDLLAVGQNPATGTAPYVTLNSATTNGGNALLNFPVITKAVFSGNNLVVTGTGVAGATVELFLVQANTVGNPSLGNGYGQGSSYLGNTTAAAADGSFTATLQLSSFTAAQKAVLRAGGSLLTSTATLAGTGTSEFSGNVPITSGPTAFDVTNLNVPQNVSLVALNPGLTVPQAADDPATPIASFTVFPATNGTLFINGVAVTAVGGQVVPVANTNQLTFTPTLGFTGAATFRFLATNTTGATSNVATYTIPVVVSNTGYIANDDELNVPKDTPTSGNVLLNDTQPTGTLTATVTAVGLVAQNGTVALSADGNYTYTPKPGYTGDDSFQYQLCQSGNCSNVATVRIRVYDGATVCITANGPNRLRNAGFEEGNTLFTSAYRFVSAADNAASANGNSGLIPETTYGVDVDAAVYHPAFTGLARSGRQFMMINGAPDQSKVYSQTVTVARGRYYTFSGFANSINPGSPAVLGFVINDKSASATATLDGTTNYIQFRGVWFSGTSTSAKFEIRDINRIRGGNDFGLDDLYFGTCSVNLLAVDQTNAPAIPKASPPTPLNKPLQGTLTGPGAPIASFIIQTLPASGTLRLGGPTGPIVTVGQIIPVNQADALYYQPDPNFSGNAVFTYTAVDTEDGGSNNIATYIIPVSAQPLPVVLTSFTAQASGRSARLAWTTASEINSAYFGVERSVSGQPGSFTAIGRVDAQGNKLSPTTYGFVDPRAADTGALVYYRLHQVDQDGKSTYSVVRSVSFVATGPAGPLTLYPNPVPGGTAPTLDLSSLPATASYDVRLLDATGRSIRAWSLTGGQPRPLALPGLAAGSYLVVVSGLQPDGSPLRQVLRLTQE